MKVLVTGAAVSRGNRLRGLPQAGVEIVRIGKNPSVIQKAGGPL